jgi:soluble lytic murein transglycosylase-like protein
VRAPAPIRRLWLPAALAGWGTIALLCAAPAGAQITSYVDESGKRVFVNAEPPPVRRNPASGGVALATRSRGAGSLPAGVANREVPPRGELERLAAEAAERHKLDPALVRAVIETESAWDPLAVSYKGAQGLMQLIPATADRFGVADPFDASQNLEGGVKYLRWLLERFGGNLAHALAAYNAGEGAVDRAGGIPRISETVAYVQKVTERYFRPDSGRNETVMNIKRPIYRLTDERGRIIITNE